MTTDSWLGASAGRARMLTKLPGRGSVLVQSSAPPDVPGRRCVDVRPGPFAIIDGDGIRMRLTVTCEGERSYFDRSELPAVEVAVAALLREDRTTVIRFGDRMACQRILPAAAVDAIERRLDATARRERGTLVTWTDGEPRCADHRVYEVVIG